jgi:hypothetical protein
MRAARRENAQRGHHSGFRRNFFFGVPVMLAFQVSFSLSEIFSNG